MAVTPFETAGVRAELHTLRRAGDRYEDPDVPFGARTAYAVVVDGERIGAVWSKRGTSYRKAGRLIARTFHPVEWGGTLSNFWQPPARLGREDWRPVTDVPEGRYVYVDDRCVGDWFRQRRDAAERVVRTWQELAA